MYAPLSSSLHWLLRRGTRRAGGCRKPSAFISRTAPCNLCGGKGFRNVIVPVNVAQPNGQPQYPGATVPFTPVAGGIPDQWGRPAGHVHWGIDPANVGV